MPTDPTAAFVADRDALVADGSLRGQVFARSLADRADAWLAALFDAAAGGRSGLALVAVGGYGRGELSPASDLDVLLLHARKRGGSDVSNVADQIWYPVWDANVPLGHAVRTKKEALDLASDDLDTATALLSTRFLAGDADMAAELANDALAAWTKRGSSWLGRLLESAEARQASFGEVAFLLEPDLKSGRGGLRDVHTLRWARQASPEIVDVPESEVEAAESRLWDVRVALHRATGRRSDALMLQDQDAVAEALGEVDADELMRKVSEAARTVAWSLDDAFASLAQGGSSRPHTRRAPASEAQHREIAGVLVDGSVVSLSGDADPAGDPVLALRLAAVAAETGLRIDPAALRALADSAAAMPDPWPPGAIDYLVAVLRSGEEARRAFEALDRHGLLVKILPEWAAVRCKPQRNALHRFTVDRHLIETAVAASARGSRVSRPDLLVLGALLHDLGKGFPGDHTAVGVEIVGTVGPRMGLTAADTDTLVQLCRHHLLLPAVATRRDLDDEATIRAVADAIGSIEQLDLLAALTEADALATGPAAWSPWKAELVDDLVRRTRSLMGGGSAHVANPDAFPTAQQFALLRAGQVTVEGRGNELTVVARDRPGLFSRVAGVLTIHGLDVLSAGALSTDEGWALEHFRVARSASTLAVEIDWPRVTADVELALAGKLAVEARVAARAQRYRPRAHSALHITPRVLFDDAATSATVLEVHAPDGVGALYRITRALAELELDLRVAKVETLAETVVDAFYVLDSSGGLITDPAHRREIELAVVHALDPG